MNTQPPLCFASDGTLLSRLRMPLRTLASFAITIPALAYSGASRTVLCVFGGIGLLLLALSFVRLGWGNEIAFDGDRLFVKRDGAIRHTIVASSIVAALVRKGTLSVIWQENGKRKSVVVGQESFLDATFQKLADALVAFAPADKLRQESGTA